MLIDPSYRLWTKKSVANHFSSLLAGIYLEGLHHWQQGATGYELRMNGPTIKEVEGIVSVDINVLVRAALTDDLFLADKMIQTVMTAFNDAIPLYKYDGVETGPFTCLLRKSDLLIRHIPLIENNVDVAQAYVQAHYEADTTQSVIVHETELGQNYFLLHDTVTHEVRKFWLENGALTSEAL